MARAKPLPFGYTKEQYGEHQTLVDEALKRERAISEAKHRHKMEQYPPYEIPEVRTLADLLANPPEETKYRIEGWQPLNSRVVTAARMKTGKTTATGNLVRSLVDLDSWLGSAEVAPFEGNVTILDFEMNEGTAAEWLRDQGIQNTERVKLVPMRGRGSSFDILDRDVRSKWADVLRTHHTAYLILDCLRPVLDAIGLDEHRDAGKFFGAFDALLTEAGITEANVIHHMGHAGDRSRGDSRIRDWPDVEWKLLCADPEDPASQRSISAFGRDVNIPETGIIFDSATRHYTLGDKKSAKAKKAESGDLERAIRRHLLECERIGELPRNKTDAVGWMMGKTKANFAAINKLMEWGSVVESPEGLRAGRWSGLLKADPDGGDPELNVGHSEFYQ